MEYVKLGNSDLEVSRIAVGGMSFGKASSEFHEWTLNEADTQEMIAFAYDLGVNFIDTANQYSGGTSEEYIGKAIRNLGIPRNQIILASKVYFNEGKLSREAIRREIEGSLTRLGTDYLDLYQIHRFDYDTPIEETMETLNELVQEGKVRYLGASAMYGYQFHNLQLCAETNGWTKFVTMQNHYNLLYREDERELIPVCRQYNVSLIPYSPLAGGHLSHQKWRTDSLRSRTDRMSAAKYDRTESQDQLIVDRVAAIAEERNVSMACVALAWLYARGAAAPIVGATKKNHFLDASKAYELKLSEEEITALEEFYLPHKVQGAR